MTRDIYGCSDCRDLGGFGGRRDLLVGRQGDEGDEGDEGNRD